jgi:hypothetical protein
MFDVSKAGWLSIFKWKEKILALWGPLQLVQRDVDQPTFETLCIIFIHSVNSFQRQYSQSNAKLLSQTIITTMTCIITYLSLQILFAGQ